MSDLTALLVQILREPNAAKAAYLLGSQLERIVGSQGAVLLLNSTHTSQLEQIYPLCRSHADAGLSLPYRVASTRSQGGTVGEIRLSKQVSESDQGLLQAILDELHRRKYVETFLAEIKRPLDFTNQDKYFGSAAELLSRALSMEMVAIRQINSENSLHCRAFYRHPGRQLLGIDFEGDSLPPPFAELVRETQLALIKGQESDLPIRFESVVDRTDPRFQFLSNSEEISEVRSFALFPVVFAGEFFGVVSCSTSADLSFSSLECSTISTAMQLISISISNFLQYHETRRMTENLHEHLFSATEIEIAQSARHELQNIETEQVLLLDELSSLLKPTREKDAISIVNKLNDSTDKLERSIAKLRYSAVHASPVSSETSVQTVWEEAVHLMQERLRMEQIKVRYVGAPLEGRYFADWLREAFLNLLLNSIDAFRDRPKQNRNISLVVQKDYDASMYYTLDYSDSAGGIQFSRLQVPQPVRDSNPDLSPEELLFQPKVSSKKRARGAGWGLYLVRQALRMHGGSVALKSSTREGATFRIQLRKLEKKGIKK